MHHFSCWSYVYIGLFDVSIEIQVQIQIQSAAVFRRSVNKWQFDKISTPSLHVTCSRKSVTLNLNTGILPLCAAPPPAAVDRGLLGKMSVHWTSGVLGLTEQQKDKYFPHWCRQIRGIGQKDVQNTLWKRSDVSLVIQISIEIMEKQKLLFHSLFTKFWLVFISISPQFYRGFENAKILTALLTFMHWRFDKCYN